MNLETVIGLEVHVELSTATKMFCACRTSFGAAPNSHVCPTCLGLPGALPVPNLAAFRYAARVALMLGCEVNRRGQFERKNYFYPDLPKAYQITQFSHPIGEHGRLEVPMEDGFKTIRITRVHLEEDAGKLLHEGGRTLVDLNRSGVPLIEIVSEPDLSSPQEARRYMEELRTLVAYLGVSDLRMEEGSMRADANISLRPKGSSVLGNRAEIKNINSFRALERALQYEVQRQSVVLAEGGTVVQETRGWDDDRGVTVGQRSKEEGHDYRYFPEPDLKPFTLSESWLAEAAQGLPATPAERRRQLLESDGLSPDDAGLLVADPGLLSYYEACRALGVAPKVLANWLLGEILRLRNAGAPAPENAALKPAGLVELIGLVGSGTLTTTVAKDLLAEIYQTGASAKQLVTERSLGRVDDADALTGFVQQVIAANPGPVADYKNGKERAIGFLVGQVMRLSSGRADPKGVETLLREHLQ